MLKGNGSCVEAPRYAAHALYLQDVCLNESSPSGSAAGAPPACAQATLELGKQLREVETPSCAEKHFVLLPCRPKLMVVRGEDFLMEGHFLCHIFPRKGL